MKANRSCKKGHRWGLSLEWSSSRLQPKLTVGGSTEAIQQCTCISSNEIGLCQEQPHNRLVHWRDSPRASFYLASKRDKSPTCLSTTMSRERCADYHCVIASIGLELARSLEIITFCFPPSTKESVA